MSARKMTASQAKIATWDAARERDRQALAIASREGISFIEALVRVMGTEKAGQLSMVPREEE